MTEPVVHALRRNLRRALYEGRLEEAETVLARLEREDPLSVHTRGCALELLLRQGRLDEADALAAALVDQFADSARVLYLAGQLAYRRKNYPHSLELFRESLRVVDSWRTRHWLGKALTQAGELDEAEAILVPLAEEQTEALQSIGWLFERKKDFEAALAAYERSLSEHRESAFVQRSAGRVRALMLDAGELSQELESLVELGDDIPPELLPSYVESLLTTGRANEARRLLAEIASGLDDRTACSVGWVCHRLKAADLAFMLLLQSLEPNLGSAKHLTTLEADAVRAGRLEELVERLRELAVHTPRLWGWVKRAERRMNG